MIYAWLAGLLILDFVGFGVLVLIVNTILEKLDKYHEETLKNVEEAKPKSPFGRYDL